MKVTQKIIILLIAHILLLVISACGSSSTPGAVLSPDASLSGLSVSEGAISPVFASGTTSYTLTTSNASTTVTPTVNQANATITVNGTSVVSGAASASIPLAVGDTVISIVVSAEDGVTTQTYTVTINRSPSVSTDATLSGITVSAGDINPAFTSSTISYTLATSSDSTTVTPSANDANATVTVDGMAVTSGAASTSIPLAVGDTSISIVVTAEDGSTSQTYTVTINRPPTVSTDATLSEITVSVGAINPVFASGTTNYTLTTSSTSTTVTPVVNQVNATVTVNGTTVASGAASASITLPLGDTVISIVVTAEDGSSTQIYTVIITADLPISSHELIDPTPGAGDVFGFNVFQLLNGNIVVVDYNDSTVANNGGAVHLYSPSSSTPIASIYGNSANDQLGSRSITVLANNNYVIATQFDDEGGVVDAGSVRLVDGSTGLQIGATLAGDVAGDKLGSSSITPLANNNYVIASQSDNEGGVVRAGSVRLVDGSTGLQIGTTLAGDVERDNLGSRAVIALSNNNYVIASPSDNDAGIVNAGSVRLMNGSTGVQIGTTLAGDVTNDYLGSDGITVLSNNNFVIASGSDNEGGLTFAGSVRLVNGSTGLQIGATLAGDVAGDSLGVTGITALGNNNYVIASQSDDENGIVDAGSVRLVNGTTGIQIGVTLTGSVEGDSLGINGITALGNNNFVIASPYIDVGGIINAGTVALVNGSTGVPIGFRQTGNVENDQLGSGSGGITALSNNNYVISAAFKDEGGVVDAGSTRLMDGTTGIQIGTTLVGDVANDRLGSLVVALNNSNYVIGSDFDDEGGIVNAGSVRLVNGTTGVQIGATLVGDVEGDRLGRGITAIGNNNYVVLSPDDDENGIVNAGSVRLVSGSNGVPIGAAIIGVASDDMNSSSVTKRINSDGYILIERYADNAGLVDSGKVRVIEP